MKVAILLFSASLFCAGVATLFIGWYAVGEIGLGMLAPLVVACVEWVVLERTYRRSPERLTNLMLASFGAKILFFGGYVAVFLSADTVRPVPFIASFVGFFVALMVAEALAIHQMTRPAQPVSGAATDLT